MLKQQSFTHSIFMQSLKCFADKNDVVMSIICNNNIFVVNSVQGFNSNGVFEYRCCVCSHRPFQFVDSIDLKLSEVINTDVLQYTSMVKEFMCTVWCRNMK